MADNVFGHLLPTAQPSPAASVPAGMPTAPGVIYGKPKAPDPYQVGKDQFQQGRDVAADRRAEEDQQMQREKFELDKQKVALDQQKVGVEQGKAGSFALRARDALGAYDKAGLDPDSMIGQWSNQAAPNIAANFSSDRRNAVRGAEREFIAAILRYDSGAAIPPQEFQTAYLTYFPTSNAGPEEIAQKKRARETALQGLLIGAGPAATKFPDATTPEAPAAGGGPRITPEQSLAIWGIDLRDKDGNPLGPDGGPSFHPDGSPAGFAARVTQDQPAPPPQGQSMGEAFGAGVGDLVEGAGDLVGLVGNPVNATINAVTGSDLSTDLGQTLRDASGLPDSQNAMVSAINKGGIGALGMAGAAGLAAKAPGAIGAAMETAASRPIAQGVGGATGAASSEYAREQGAGPLGQLAAGLAGGLTGFGATSTAGRLAGKVAGSPNEILMAADRQKVPLIPADVGGATTRRLTGAAAQAPVSAAPVVNAAQRSTTATGKALGRAATSQGEVQTTDVAGEQVRKAGQDYISSESARIGRLYDNAGQAAKGVKIKPIQALAEIDSQIARFAEIGDIGDPIVKSLQGLRSSIEGGVSVQGMRDARTLLSQGVHNGKLRSNQEQKLLKDVIEKLSSDIEAGLKNAGRDGAARTFKRADTLWRDRIQHIDEVLEPVIGKTKSGEDVLRAVEGMMRGTNGGASRLRGVLKEMPPEQAGDVRATIIDRLGKAGAGAQDDTGAAFSSATFLTNWNKMTPQAKAVLFSEDRLRANLDDIAKIANASKQAQRYANHSNTAGGLAANVGGAAGLAYASPTAAALALGSQYLTGALLASPRFTAWLARAPKSPDAQLRFIEQLGVVASKEPAIAGDAQALQQHLQQSFGASPARVAASEKENDGRPKPPKR